MTPALRRSHRTIWLVLAVALPVGFGAALNAVKPIPEQAPVSQPLPDALPVVVRSVDTPTLRITLRRTTQPTNFQLDVVVKTALDVPSAVVRVQQPSGWQSIGLLSAPGMYRFSLPGSGTHPHIELVDDLHRRTLFTCQF